VVRHRRQPADHLGAAEQATWYAGVSNLFGLPLQVPHSYAKSDWEMWTAAWLSGYPIKQQLIEQVYTYANTTPSRVPFSDLYDTISGDQNGFQARPVQGGMFALLALRNRR
jgi:Glutaminase A six helical-hairpin domain